MHNAKKYFTAFLSAMALSLASVGTSISAFAEEVETTKSAETMAVSEASESTAETDNQCCPTRKPQKMTRKPQKINRFSHFACQKNLSFK